MVEVLVAAVLLLVTMIPMGIFLTNATSSAVAARQREAALQLADSWVEILSNTQPLTNSDGSVLTSGTFAPQVPDGAQAPAGSGVPGTAQLAGTNYNISAQYRYEAVDDIGQSDLCSARASKSNAPGCDRGIGTGDMEGRQGLGCDCDQLPQARAPNGGLPGDHCSHNPAG